MRALALAVLLALLLPLAQPPRLHVYVARTHTLTLCDMPEASAVAVEIGVAPDCSFELLNRTLRSAKSFIYLCCYEFWSVEIAQLLISCAKRGVHVMVLLEGDCYGDVPDEYNRYICYLLYSAARDESLPIEVKLERDASRYLHAKFVVVDNMTVLVSSGNFVPTTFPSDPTAIPAVKYPTPARDWVIVVHSAEVAKEFAEVFLSWWAESTPYDPSTDGSGYEPEPQGVIRYTPKFRPLRTTAEILRVVFSPLNSFESLRTLVSQTSHFALFELMYIIAWSDSAKDLLSALRSAGNITGVFILENNMSYYVDAEELLKQYRFYVAPAFKKNETLFCHAKGIIIDDLLVFVGSINWSDKSLRENYEAGVIVRSRDVALYFKRVFAHDWDLSSQLAFDDDGDGLPDPYEIDHGLNTSNPDTDGDGFSDYDEVMIYGTDPRDPTSRPTEDTEPPEILEFYPKNGAVVRSPVTISWSVRDNVGISHVELLVNGTRCNCSKEENGSCSITLGEGWWLIELYVYDLANNSAHAVSLIRVDNTPPEIRVFPSENKTISISNESLRVRFSWSVSDNVEIADVNVSLDGKLVSKKNTGSHVAELSPGSHQFVVEARDLAGNTNRVLVVIEIKHVSPEARKEVVRILFLAVLVIMASVLVLALLRLRRVPRS